MIIRPREMHAKGEEGDGQTDFELSGIITTNGTNPGEVLSRRDQRIISPDMAMAMNNMMM